MNQIPIRRIHANSRKPHASERFNIREVQELLKGKDMVQELHRHDFFFILALKKGNGTHQIDFVPYPIGNHSVFFLRPGQVHQLSLKKGSSGFLIELNKDFYYPHHQASIQLLRHASSTNYVQLNESQFKKIYMLLRFTLEEYTYKQEKYQEVIKANLGILFIELVRNRLNNEISSSPVSPYPQERLEEFLDLLETHISTHKRVSDYANMMHLSSYQLNAITKSGLGKTSSELIIEHITLESKRLLLATTNQVNLIAQQLGFEDVSYFIRFFKKHTGYSPEAFRHHLKMTVI